MEKIIMQRGYGKTYHLIKKSAHSGNYIVCRSMQEASLIQREAKEAGFDIPMPLSYDEFINKKYYSKGINGFLVDDIERFFTYLSDVPVNAITMCP
jgi:hypothetical protein